MAKKKRKSSQPLWRRGKVVRRLALIAAALVLVAVLAAWAVLPRGGHDGGQTQYLLEPASPFSLPTIAGQQASLADHLGKHPLLLYFNEGMG